MVFNALEGKNPTTMKDMEPISKDISQMFEPNFKRRDNEQVTEALLLVLKEEKFKRMKKLRNLRNGVKETKEEMDPEEKKNKTWHEVDLCFNVLSLWYKVM